MKHVLWGRVVLGGLLAELAIFAIVIPLSLLAGQASLPLSAPPASFLATLIFGLWVARKAPRNRVLHGALVGVVAVVIYVAMSLGRPEPTAFIVAHVLKLLGGVVGGFLASRRATTTVATDIR